VSAGRKKTIHKSKECFFSKVYHHGFQRAILNLDSIEFGHNGRHSMIHGDCRRVAQFMVEKWAIGFVK
jgi:hypothetical protein